jgi:hypothetical protein
MIRPHAVSCAEAKGPWLGQPLAAAWHRQWRFATDHPPTHWGPLLQDKVLEWWDFLAADKTTLTTRTHLHRPLARGGHFPYILPIKYG